MMTVGVSVLVADPGANKLLTAAFTLSRERPGGREGEEGSSRPRGFFCFGGTASEDEAAGEVTGEDVVTGGMTGSVSVSWPSPSVLSSSAGC